MHVWGTKVWTVCLPSCVFIKRSLQHVSEHCHRYLSVAIDSVTHVSVVCMLQRCCHGVCMESYWSKSGVVWQTQNCDLVVGLGAPTHSILVRLLYCYLCSMLWGFIALSLHHSVFIVTFHIMHSKQYVLLWRPSVCVSVCVCLSVPGCIPTLQDGPKKWNNFGSSYCCNRSS